jgi:hypothetical protein
MKLKFSQWYEANFVELMRKLKAKGIGAETIQAFTLH